MPVGGLVGGVARVHPLRVYVCVCVCARVLPSRRDGCLASRACVCVRVRVCVRWLCVVCVCVRAHVCMHVCVCEHALTVCV